MHRQAKVAPIYNTSGKQSIYLPRGQWIDYWSHEVIKGPQVQFAQAPLPIMPLYVRANALIPTVKPAPYLSDEPFDFVIFNAYLLDHGSFKLVDNDSLTHVSAELTADGWLDVRLDGIKRKAGLRVIPLPGRPAIQQVTVKGRPLPAGRSFAASADVARRLGTGPE